MQGIEKSGGLSNESFGVRERELCRHYVSGISDPSRLCDRVPELTPVEIPKILASREGRAAIQELQALRDREVLGLDTPMPIPTEEEVVLALRGMAAKALRLLYRVLDDETIPILKRVPVAQDALGRSGFGKHTVIHTAGKEDRSLPFSQYETIFARTMSGAKKKQENTAKKLVETARKRLETAEPAEMMKTVSAVEKSGANGTVKRIPPSMDTSAEGDW